MPVQINTRLLKSKKDDFADKIKTDTINIAVSQFAEQVSDEIKSAQCEKHPDQISHLTVIGDRERTMYIEKKFCCDEFSSRINVTVE